MESADAGARAARGAGNGVRRRSIWPDTAKKFLMTLWSMLLQSICHNSVRHPRTRFLPVRISDSIIPG
jgi:hypothetical protein